MSKQLYTAMLCLESTQIIYNTSIEYRDYTDTRHTIPSLLKKKRYYTEISIIYYTFIEWKFPTYPLI